MESQARAYESPLDRAHRSALAVCVIAAVIGGGCFSETPLEDDDGPSPPGSGGTATSAASMTDGGPDPSAGSATSSATSATAADSTSAVSMTSGDTSGPGPETSGSTGEPVFDPCPELIETFDVCPDAPWLPSGAGAVTCDGDAVLTVTSAVDGNVSMLLPVGLADATAVVDLGQAPATSMLKMLRIRTPGGQILAFRINGYPGGPSLEAYVDNMGSTNVLASMPHDAAQHQWVRMREDAGQLYFETSPDGVAFAAFHDLPTPFDLSDATVGLAAGNYVALGADTPVSFGQFEYYCTSKPG